VSVLQAASRRSARRLPVWPGVVVVGGAVAFVALTWYLKFVVGGYWFGAPLAPLFLYPDVEVSLWALPAALVFVAGVAAAPPLRDARLSPGAFAGLALFLGLAVRLALAAARDGSAGWLSGLGVPAEAANEYLGALPALQFGWGTFLDRFAEVAPSFPTHPSAHPPGLLLLIDALGITTNAQMATFEIAGGALATPLAYLLARRFLDEAGASTAALLFVFSPAIMIYGVTSTDAFFVTLGLAASCALVARSEAARWLGAALLAIASFFSYSLLAVGAWAALVALVREGPVSAVRLGVQCAAALVALYAGLWALTGFDLFGALDSADLVYRIGVYYSRPYAYWLLGSPVAWVVALGLPIAWYAARAARAGYAAAIALVGIVVVAAVGGYTKSETERIWMFMVAFACIGAAAVMPGRRLVPVLALLAAEAFVIELLTDTKY